MHVSWKMSINTKTTLLPLRLKWFENQAQNFLRVEEGAANIRCGVRAARKTVDLGEGNNL